jgi:hypothetical protein
MQLRPIPILYQYVFYGTVTATIFGLLSLHFLLKYSEGWSRVFLSICTFTALVFIVGCSVKAYQLHIKDAAQEKDVADGLRMLRVIESIDARERKQLAKYERIDITTTEKKTFVLKE